MFTFQKQKALGGESARAIARYCWGWLMFKEYGQMFHQERPDDSIERCGN